jgi:adenine phosphoribosyltransferase
MNISTYLREIPDFPKPGVVFKDITPLLANPEAYRITIERFTASVRESGANAIIGIESRGFIFAAPVAFALKLPLLLVRKPGKLPADTIGVQYSLEYGTGSLELHRDSVTTDSRVAIIDDVLATGGTAAAAGELVQKLGGQVSSYLFLLEIPFLKGREKLSHSTPVTVILSA